MTNFPKEIIPEGYNYSWVHYDSSSSVVSGNIDDLLCFGWQFVYKSNHPNIQEKYPSLGIYFDSYERIHRGDSILMKHKKTDSEVLFENVEKNIGRKLTIDEQIELYNKKYKININITTPEKNNEEPIKKLDLEDLCKEDGSSSCYINDEDNFIKKHKEKYPFIISSPYINTLCGTLTLDGKEYILKDLVKDFDLTNDQKELAHKMKYFVSDENGEIVTCPLKLEKIYKDNLIDPDLLISHRRI